MAQKKRSRIYTITPNPALDLSGTVEQLIANEKNYITHEARFPGGNAINVARILTRLKVPVCASGFLGNNIGNEVKKLLDDEKVKNQFVRITNDTRISLSILNHKTEQQTRLSFAGPRVNAAEVASLTSKIMSLPRSSILVLGGSFPPGFQVAHANRMIRSAIDRKLSVVIDVPGPLLKKIDLNGVLLIKPNLVEFQELIGLKAESLPSIVKAAQKLAQKVRFVCVSSVAGGAILVSKNGVWFGSIPKIKIQSTVGAGDSMIAGMISQYWKQNSQTIGEELLMPELLRHGLAASAATLITSGTQLGSAKDIAWFSSQINIKYLNQNQS
jgi:6-phosphofructokinase 2